MKTRCMWLAEHGLQTILAREKRDHRAQQLEGIVEELGRGVSIKEATIA